MERDPTTVADLVEAAVAASPDATAVVAGDRSLTYAELDRRANRLASHLRSCGVGPDVAVGICLGRSVELAVALVAVLKAGGACVPLDPAYPAERLAFMVEDAAVAAVLTSARLAGRVPATAAPVLRLDADASRWAGEPADPPPRAVGPAHLAYLIYTSGSTGRPRGVMLTHRGLVDHHRAAVALYRLAPGDRVLQFCSISFDASIEELFPTWAAGATVVFRPDDAPLLGRSWWSWVDGQGLTVVNLPTGYWHAWARDLDARGDEVPPRIRLVVVGGEKALGPVYRTWMGLSGGRSRWVNVYGPTETTCMSTAWEAPPDGGLADDQDPPIGRPLPGTTVEVVDDGLRPVPAGVVGELLIGGPGVARGYRSQPALTAERFVTDPDGRRRYRTGDLVRELPDGTLDFVGRIDDQVKVRGFRVECGEVEAALARHPAVASAAVVARRDDAGSTQLSAYVVPRGGAALTAGDLRDLAADRLPAYMVPATFTVLGALPLTANGKVDRAALPMPDPAAGPPPTSPGGAAGRPRSPVEERLAAIWARVLGRDDVGLDDDFFGLGGHSLLATQVIAQVREELGTQTPLQAIFEAPTVAGLAALVEAEGGGPAAAPPLGPRRAMPGDRLSLSLAQEQMWRLEAAASPPGLYNVTVLHRFEGPVDPDALRAALAYLGGRHEVLRTRFGAEAGRPYQVVEPDAPPVELAVADLAAAQVDRPPDGDEPEGGGAGADGDEPGGSVELLRRVAEQDARPFDPAQPPLARASLLRAGGAGVLALTVDHLICDGTAASLLITEAVAAASAIGAGRAPDLGPLPLQFADFAAWQRAAVTDDVVRRQLAWWAAALDGMPLGPALPWDSRPPAPTRRVASAAVTVGPGTRAALDEVARSTSSTLFVVTLAAVQAVLARLGGTTDVVVSTTLSGRTRTELEHMVGMFSGFGRVRTDLSGDPTFTEAVARVRERVLGMFDNSDIPFMRVRRELLPDHPTGGIELVAALPVDFQYFRAAPHDHEVFFRGQLHPLGVTLLDDGAEIEVQLSYKPDFYRPQTVLGLAGGIERVLAAVGAHPSVRLSELPVTGRSGR
ncbi:MAG: amino acid adenylation domain-containing protein [Acidimicrobiales bacterium]